MLDFNIDSYHNVTGKGIGHIGADYSYTGHDFFILSDGCSSSQHSDLVSKIQTHLIKSEIESIKILQSDPNYELSKEELEETWLDKIPDIAWRLNGIMKNQLDIVNTSPLATLMIGEVFDGKIHLTVFGDGVIAIKNNDDEVEVIELSYSSNAPYYPFYYKDDRYKEIYDQNFKDTLYIKDHVSYIKDGNFLIAKESATQELDLYKPYLITLDIKSHDLNSVYLFSDGISEISNGINKLSLIDSITPFLNIKNTNGTFIERRCKRQLSLFEKQGYYPYDDFSMAGISFYNI